MSSDLLLFENDEIVGVLSTDVVDVSNYVAAMEHGLKRIKEGFPLSLRLIREMHEVLLNRGRGCAKQPGEFRRSQNWIGGTRPGNAKFVPPPPEKLTELMSDLEKFLHDEIVKEITGKARNKIYVYHKYLDILSEGVAPI